MLAPDLVRSSEVAAEPLDGTDHHAHQEEGSMIRDWIT
jgi:hypothetical protein